MLEAASFRTRYTMQPHLQKSSNFVRSSEKKWGEDPAPVKRDIDDRISFRLISLERRIDHLETAMKIGVFVVVVAGAGAATYQNWGAIQDVAIRAWQSLPPSDKISPAFWQRWDDLKSYFAKPN